MEVVPANEATQVVGSPSSVAPVLFPPYTSPSPSPSFQSSSSNSDLALLTAAAETGAVDSSPSVAETAPFARVTRGLKKRLSGGTEQSTTTNDEKENNSPKPEPKETPKSGRGRGRPPLKIKKEKHKEKESPKTAPKNDTPKTGRRGRIKKQLIQRARLVTALPVNRMPFMYEEILKRLEPEKRDRVDLFELQNLIVSTNLDEATEGLSEETVVEQVLAILKTDDAYMKDLSSTRRRVMDSRFLSEKEADEEALKRYEDYINSEENQRLLSYRTDSATRHVWSDKDIAKFFEAFKKYGNGPTSNRLIAKAIGPNVHPNHVAHFKAELRKKQKQSERAKGKPLTPTKTTKAWKEPTDEVSLNDVIAAATAVNKAIKQAVIKKGAVLNDGSKGKGTKSKRRPGRPRVNKAAGSEQKGEETASTDATTTEDMENGDGKGKQGDDDESMRDNEPEGADGDRDGDDNEDEGEEDEDEGGFSERRVTTSAMDEAED